MKFCRHILPQVLYILTHLKTFFDVFSYIGITAREPRLRVRNRKFYILMKLILSCRAYVFGWITKFLGLENAFWPGYNNSKKSSRKGFELHEFRPKEFSSRTFGPGRISSDFSDRDKILIWLSAQSKKFTGNSDQTQTNSPHQWL